MTSVLSSCAHLSPGSAPSGVSSDSTTVALWRMDDPITTDQVMDSGPRGLHGVAGDDVQVDQGHDGQAKVFSGGPEAFVYVPDVAPFDALGTMVVEAWIRFDPQTANSIQIIAGRWNLKMGEQSWVFFLGWPLAQSPPEFHLLFPTSYVISSQPFGRPVYFAVVTDHAPSPQLFSANGDLTFRPGWNHVAVSMDGEKVTFYINGEMDSSSPCSGQVARTKAHLTVGNLVEVKIEANKTAWYQGIRDLGFTGMIDDARISTIGRVRSLSDARP
jgi:hypothetical protein